MPVKRKPSSDVTAVSTTPAKQLKLTQKTPEELQKAAIAASTSRQTIKLSVDRKRYSDLLTQLNLDLGGEDGGVPVFPLLELISAYGTELSSTTLFYMNGGGYFGGCVQMNTDRFLFLEDSHTPSLHSYSFKEERLTRLYGASGGYAWGLCLDLKNPDRMYLGMDDGIRQFEIRADGVPVKTLNVFKFPDDVHPLGLLLSDDGLSMYSMNDYNLVHFDTRTGVRRVEFMFPGSEWAGHISHFSWATRSASIHIGTTTHKTTLSSYDLATKKYSSVWEMGIHCNQFKLTPHGALFIQYDKVTYKHRDSLESDSPVLVTDIQLNRPDHTMVRYTKIQSLFYLEDEHSVLVIQSDRVIRVPLTSEFA